LRAATVKIIAFVQKLWRISLPCGRLRKTGRKSATAYFLGGYFDNLNDVKQMTGNHIHDVTQQIGLALANY
jgi:hypothetical protein